MSEERTSEPVEGGWVTLSASSVNYDKVIFSDIPKTYSFENITVRFEKAKGVVVSPNDFVGVYKIGFKNVSECLLKGVWQPAEISEARVVFEAEELRKLDESEFYQFVYVSSEDNIYGASTPFRLQPPSEDVFAEISDDDFLVVRSKLKEENINLKKLMQKAAVRTSIQNNRNRVLEQENAELKVENMKLKVIITKLKFDLHAEIQNNGNHDVEEQLKEENMNLKKEIEKLRSDLCAEAQNSRNLIVDEQSLEKKAATGTKGPRPQIVEAANENQEEEEEEMSTIVDYFCPQTKSWKKERGILAYQNVQLSKDNMFLAEKVNQLEKKIAEQNVTLAEDMEAIKKYHHKIKVLNEKSIGDRIIRGEDSTSSFLRLELQEKESQLEAIKQSNTLVHEELHRQLELQKVLNKKIGELLTDEAQLANKASIFEKDVYITNQKLENALIDLDTLETEKKQLELKVLELQETIEASKEVFIQASKEKVYDREVISKLTEHMHQTVKHIDRLNGDHFKALMFLETEKDKVIKDMKARLDEASNIFKQQYREIEKLKKMVKRLNATKTKSENECATVKVRREFPESSKYISDENEYANVKAREFPSSSKYMSDDDMSPSSSLKNASDGPVNDSDTGEHVGLLDLKSEPFSDGKNEAEEKDIGNVPSSRVSPNVFPNSASDSVFVDGEVKPSPDRSSCKQRGSPSEEHYFGAAYTARPTFTYPPIMGPPRRRFYPMRDFKRMR